MKLIRYVPKNNINDICIRIFINSSWPTNTICVYDVYDVYTIQFAACISSSLWTTITRISNFSFEEESIKSNKDPINNYSKSSGRHIICLILIFCNESFLGWSYISSKRKKLPSLNFLLVENLSRTKVIKKCEWSILFEELQSIQNIFVSNVSLFLFNYFSFPIFDPHTSVNFKITYLCNKYLLTDPILIAFEILSNVKLQYHNKNKSPML